MAADYDILVKDASGASVSLAKQIGRYYMDADVATRLLPEGPAFFEGFTAFNVKVGRTPVEWCKETRNRTHGGSVFKVVDAAGAALATFTLYEIPHGDVGKSGMILCYNDRKVNTELAKPFAPTTMDKWMRDGMNASFDKVRIDDYIDIITTLGGEDDAWVVDDASHDKVTADVLKTAITELRTAEATRTIKSWASAMRCLRGGFQADVCILMKTDNLFNDAKTAVCDWAIPDLFQPIYRKVVSIEVAAIRAKTRALAAPPAAGGGAGGGGGGGGGGGRNRKRAAAAPAGSNTLSAAVALASVGAGVNSHRVTRGARAHAHTRARNDDDEEEEDEDEEEEVVRPTRRRTSVAAAAAEGVTHFSFPAPVAVAKAEAVADFSLPAVAEAVAAAEAAAAAEVDAKRAKRSRFDDTARQIKLLAKNLRTLAEGDPELDDECRALFSQL